jgi:hypothetical protein
MAHVCQEHALRLVRLRCLLPRAYQGCVMLLELCNIQL